jgi:hypothetical protein
MAQIALCDAGGPLTELIKRLASDHGSAWLFTLKASLRHGATAFQIWKKVRLGTFQSVGHLQNALHEQGYETTLALLLDSILLAQSEIEIGLVKISVEDLGFKADKPYEYIYSREEICARATKLGFDRVPAEAAAQLRLQYPDQPLDERLHVAIETLTSKDNSYSVSSFEVHTNRNGRWLIDSATVNRDLRYTAKDLWIFTPQK